MEEFVWGLQLDEEALRPYDEDMFMEEDGVPKDFEEKKDETGGWSEVVDFEQDKQLKSEDEEDVVPDEMLHEVPVGKDCLVCLSCLMIGSHSKKLLNGVEETWTRKRASWLASMMKKEDLSRYVWTRKRVSWLMKCLRR